MEKLLSAEALAAIIGVVVGTSLTGLSSLLTSRNRQRRIKATVKHDLQALWNRIFPRLERFLNEHQADAEKNIFKTQFPFIRIGQNYFACFDAIAGEIAVLSDQAISQEIFDTYVAARGVVDTLLTNNEIPYGSDRIIYGRSVFADIVDFRDRLIRLCAKL